jgi:1,2-phenylacetyl-CoA epoxidase catalytic subunit
MKSKLDEMGEAWYILKIRAVFDGKSVHQRILGISGRLTLNGILKK